MYNNDVTRIPRTEDDLWDVLEEQFDFVRLVLWETPVESKEDALSGKYDKLPDDTISKDRGMKVIGYRGRNDKYDQRDHYLEMGRELLPYVHQAIDERTLTPEFVQQWGKIMFCHGYIASFYFDDTDDLRHAKAGRITGQKRSKDLQRKWLTHMFTQLRSEGETRPRAEERIALHIQSLIDRGDFPPGFHCEWFKEMLSYGDLRTTYNEKHFFRKEMKMLVRESIDDIPPIPKIP
jgi:hypothetical protein